MGLGKGEQMKPSRWLWGIWLGMNGIGLAALGMGWAALSDIFHDYVSRQALANAGVEASLPEWTQTAAEWSWVLLVWAFCLALTALNVLITGWFFLRRPAQEGRRVSA